MSEKRKEKKNSIEEVKKRGEVVAKLSLDTTTKRKNKKKKVTKKMKKMKVLTDELMNKLENSDEVSILQSSSRKKIVDWEVVADELTRTGWFSIDMLSDYVESNYNKNKLHYSEALRFIRTSSRLWNVKVNKREIQSGEDKGVYYRFTKK